MTETEVVIVGAGPAGLTAAIALARAGVETLVLERRTHTSREARATGISTSTMELMRSWGLEEELRDGDMDVELRPWVTETLAAADRGHSADAGFPTREQAAVISPTAPATIPQDHLEPVLERHARSFPTVRVERGVEVTDIEHVADGAVLTVREGEGGGEREIRRRAVAGGERRIRARAVESGGERRIRARFLIGADGVRSTVRQALDIPAARREELGGSLGVTFRAPLWELLGEHRYAIYWLARERPPVFVPQGGDRWVFATFWDPARGAVEDLSPADVIPWIREAAGYEDLAVQVDRIAFVPFGVDLADRFREGNVFLAGDAAHRVTPRGATGLNTAIRSGYDLGWKLAWVLRGWAGDALLDSYEAERRPVAEHNVMRSAQPSGTLSPVSAELRIDLGGRIAHLWLPGEDERVSTLDLLGEGVTLFTGPEGEAWEALTDAIAPVPVAVRSLDGLTARALGIIGRGALLVRPDGVPAGLWTDVEHGAAGLSGAVKGVTGQRTEAAALAA